MKKLNVRVLNMQALNAIVRAFFQMESSSGILLLVSAVLALGIANSAWSDFYENSVQSVYNVYINGITIPFSIRDFVNDGLMTLFFLLIGLQLKVEWAEGRLSFTKQMVLPSAAALGGMLLPALIYLVLCAGHPDLTRGWAIPTATDIAFSLGVLSLFGRRVPVGLIFFLMLLAILDDAGAVLIIALFYSGHGSGAMVGWVAVVMAALMLLGHFQVKSFVPWIILGALLWVCLHHAGIHPVLSGVLLAIAMPAKGRDLLAGRLLTMLHPWVAFGIMPLFALVNAGVSLHGESSLASATIVTAIVAGLVVGKPLGVVGMSALLVWRRWAVLPMDATWGMFVGVAFLCGIGFTMSLFIGTLAFPNQYLLYMSAVKQGVLLGSLLSGLIGVVILFVAYRVKCRSET